MRLITLKKVKGIIRRLSDEGLDSALFVNAEPVRDPNIEYLTGLAGMQTGALIIRDGKTTLLPTELDYDRAVAEATADEIARVDRKEGFYKSLRSHMKGGGKTGVCTSRLTVATAKALRLSRSSMKDIGLMMAEERSVKEPGEIEVIEDASRITNSCIKFLEDAISPEATGTEIASGLEDRMKRLGSQKPAFETIVTSGKGSAFVHPSPSATEKRIGKGIGLVDFGVLRKGYVSDVTVPFCCGRPTKRQERIISCVSDIWRSLEDSLREGAAISELHAIYEKGMKHAGFDVKHALGHGIGLEVHEYPSLSGMHEEKLKSGMVVAVEPGAYEAGTGGVRLENDILIQKDGFKRLTKSKLIRL